MPISVDTGEALDLKNLPQTPRLRVLRVEAEDYTNWDGEAALKVTILLDESVEVEELTGWNSMISLAPSGKICDDGVLLSLLTPIL